MSRQRRLVFIGVAFATFALAASTVFRQVVREGFGEVVLTETQGPSSLATLFGDDAGLAAGQWHGLLQTDHRFNVWVTARNARALLVAPHRFFDAEPCHPADNTLAFGHPLLTFGLLGVPAHLAAADPVATLNFVMMLLPILAALAMYLLIVEWTGVPAAGIAAGLLFGFHASKLANVVHPFADDTGWTVFGLLFLSRFFSQGRARDGIAASLAYVLQIGSSLYSVVTSLVVSGPFALWLLWHYRLRAVRLGPTLVSIGVFALLAGWILSPYATVLDRGGAAGRGRFYASWDAVAPMGFGFLLIVGLAILGLFFWRGRGLAGTRSARWVLAGIAVSCALIATGGNVNARRLAEAAGRDVPVALPNLYEVLAAALPGIKAVRVVGFTDAGTHLALCILAGLGAAQLVRMARGRGRHIVAVALIVSAWVGALGAPWVGVTSPVALATAEIRPAESTLAFFRELERIGNTGPILELPAPSGLGRASQNAARQLTSAYHHRRTSSCYNSYVPKEMAEVVRLSDALPRRDAISALKALGFTTLVVHHLHGKRDGAWKLQRALSQSAQGTDAPLRLVHETPRLSAFAIE